MTYLNRRDLLQSAGLLLASSRLQAGSPAGAGSSSASDSVSDWIRSTRILIAEAYNPPFYPSLDYDPDRAVSIARQLNADGLRYPAASYYAYFPTKSGYPVHPELKGDPMRRTIELCRNAGLKTVAYLPLNHPFMEAKCSDPRYTQWSRSSPTGGR